MSKLSEVQRERLAEYIKALRKAEAIMTAADANMIYVEGSLRSLYGISQAARESIYLVAEELADAIVEAQESE